MGEAAAPAQPNVDAFIERTAAVLMSLARLGHVAIANGGQKFEIRRAA